jgi:SNF2 family DNA or RNA helicase
LLKRLRAWLDDASIPCGYIDGSTRDRLAVCDTFNNDPSIPLCLISLKAGGTGLNLTGADTVIHFDPWWNPAVEDQATDRAHRIGQSRTVTSYKLVTEGTVEDRVLGLQIRKAALLKDLLDESALQSAKVDLETLKALMS